MQELMIQIKDVSKEYRYGMIGRTSLKDELKRKKAKRKNLEDPTSKIGREHTYADGDTFLALDSVSFDVKRGEALGIIGHNGAGKSTLLKLINRITAPTSGVIRLNGRVASMLEVGTGFHPELTGKENIYLNGAILGMTTKEIDSRLEEIIEFSECRRFIDTPVKRYSSGMHVKLGFSIAAHLNAEIVIMDEVLAVGDVDFQNKCIKKMREVADSGRTILYVSHNMATIRSLCDRCVVLSRGKLIFDGDVEDAIEHYVTRVVSLNSETMLDTLKRPYRTTELTHFKRIEYLSGNNGIFMMGDVLRFRLDWSAKRAFDQLKLRIGIFTLSQIAVGVCFTDSFSAKEGENSEVFSLDISHLLPGKYCLELLMVELDDNQSQVKHDVLHKDAVVFEIDIAEEKSVFKEANRDWGHYVLPGIKLNSHR